MAEGGERSRSERPCNDPAHARQSNADAPQLALDLGGGTVALLRREGLEWREVARAGIRPDGTLASASALLRAARDEAMEFDGTAAPTPRVTLWLPPEQVLVRRLALPPGEPARWHAALADAAAVSGQRTEDLALDIAAPGPDGRSVVLAAFAQSCREARAYAEGWGFAPAAVSTAVEAAAFGPGGPEFRTGGAGPIPASPTHPASALEEPARADARPARPPMPGAAARPAAPKARRRVAAIGTLAAIALGLVIHAAPWERNAATPDRSASVESAAAQPEMDGPGARHAFAPEAAEPEGSSTRPTPDIAATDTAAGQQAGPVPARVPWPAPLVARTGSTVDLWTGAPEPSAPPPPARPAPSALAAPSSPAGLPELDLPPGIATAEADASADMPIDARPDAPNDGAGDAQPAIVRPGPTLWKQPVRTRGGPSPSLAASAIAAEGPGAAASDMPAAELADGTELAELAPGVLAPGKSIAPRTRPADDPAAVEGASDDAAPRAPSAATGEGEAVGEGEAAEIPQDASALAPAASPSPRLRGQGGTAADEVDVVGGRDTGAADPGADAPGGEDAGEPASEHAAADAPRPSPRPATLGAPIRPSARNGGGTGAAMPALPGLSRSAPRQVQRSAVEQGIPLDRTALIGILDIETGRQALLRLPNGRYERLMLGDSVEGWTVSAIGIDAMRLTRNGEERTLRLVNR
ncbi:hypothetical protein M1105_13280 [Limibaculum sp. FT325]|uniref:hypothetical protein n=1 Tax=Thermohalobaculum sediminis TaxID=2939436 RepID=UPI0020BDD0B5|nr:hypothetical protein [Limibaculum sediminis]MCL5777955.1 hypothetical protein [Limibaculum sediminis]